MPDHKDEMIPAAQTPAEVNVHLSYIRRDIKVLQDETKNTLANIEKKIDNLDDHYIIESEFQPIVKAVEAHDTALKGLTEWRDTFNGKMAGFSLAIVVASSALSFALNYFLR